MKMKIRTLIIIYVIFLLQTHLVVGVTIRALQISTQVGEENPSDGEVMAIPPRPPPDEELSLNDADSRKIIKEELEPLKAELNNHNIEIHKALDSASKQIGESLNTTQENVTIELSRMAYHMNKQLESLGYQIDVASDISDSLTLAMQEEKIKEKEDELKETKKKIEKLQLEIPQLKGSCDSGTNCVECLALTGCGWCSMEKKCVDGDEIGPLYVNCNFYDFHTCRGAQCIHYIDCESCLSEPACGWCDDRINNDEGCIEADPSYQGCVTEGWYHSEGIQQQCERREYQTNDQINGEAIRDWEDQDDDDDDADSLDDDEYIENNEQDRDWEENDTTSQGEQRQQREMEIDGLTPSEKEQLYTKKTQELKENQKKAKNLEKEIKTLKQEKKELQDRKAAEKAEEEQNGEEDSNQTINNEGQNGEDGEDDGEENEIENDGEQVQQDGFNVGVISFQNDQDSSSLQQQEMQSEQNDNDDEAILIRAMLDENDDDVDSFAQTSEKQQHQFISNGQNQESNQFKKVYEQINRNKEFN